MAEHDVTDLTEFLTPDLKLKYKDKIYTVPPPTKEAGRKLALLYAFVVTASDADRADDTVEAGRHLVQTMGSDDIAVLALGQETHDEMLADGIPGAHIDTTFAMYALFYWVAGERTAKAIFAAQKGPDALGEALGLGPGLGRTSPPRPGPRMASARPTSGASFRRTAAPRRN